MTKTYIVVYLASFCAALLLTPWVIRIARVFKLVDMPSLRKVHRRPVPRVGGVAIALAMLFAAVPALLFGGAGARSFHNLPPPFLALLGGSALMLLVGLLDDLFNLPAQLKLIAVVLASLLLCASGGRIEVLHITEHGAIQLGRLAWPVTVLWITVVTVSINFIDGLDGLAAGISAVAAGVIAVLASSTGNAALAIVSLALLGSLTAFLFFNFNPARVFMGDCGSMFLGFTLGACGILCASEVETPLGLALPALALGIPLLDTLFTVIRRGILERRSLFSAERGHIHHRLIDRGWSHRRVVLLLYGATAVVVCVGLLASHARIGRALTTGVTGLLVLLAIFHAAGAARAVETIRALKRNRGIRLEIRNGRRVFEGSHLSLRGALSFEEWWQEICAAAKLLGARTLSLEVRERDGKTRLLQWDGMPSVAAADHDETTDEGNRIGANGNGGGANGKAAPTKVSGPAITPGTGPAVLAVAIPVRHRRVGSPLRLHAEIAVENEFEGAGHRVALFARLIDECSLARLPGGSECIARPPRHDQKSEKVDRAKPVLAAVDAITASAGSNGAGGTGGDGQNNGNGHRQDDAAHRGNGDRSG